MSWAADKILVRDASLTPGLLARAKETSDLETPAARATSMMVGREYWDDGVVAMVLLVARS